MTMRAASLIGAAVLSVVASTEGAWRKVYIKSGTTFTPLWVNETTNYPDFTLMGERGNATVYIRIKGVTYPVFEDVMNNYAASPTPKFDLTYSDGAGVKLDMLLSTNLNLMLGKLLDVSVSVNVRNGRQTDVEIILLNGYLRLASVRYGRPAIVLPNTPQFGAGYRGLVKVRCDNNIGGINVYGGIISDCLTSKNINNVICRAKNDKKFGLKYGGIIGGNVFAAGDIRFVYCDNGIGTVVRAGVPQALVGRVCAGWSGTAPSQGDIWRVVAMGGADNNSIITAGSNPAGTPATYQYAGIVYQLRIGTKGPCNNLTVVSRARTEVSGAGAGPATGNVITSVGTFPL
ncbi:MAG: hypothetical protein N2595_01715 [bacterium]|nr:hypothetical protein [bacterium]